MMKTRLMPLLTRAALSICSAPAPAAPAPAAPAPAAPAPAAPAPAAPATVTVGDPRDPGALAQAVSDAYKGGARRIVIKPGVYTLPDVGHTAFALDGWRDAVLSAYGVTLIVTDLKQGHNVSELNRYAGVILRGPTLSQSSITSYQGRVVAMGQDDKGKAYCDWKPDVGYPVPPAGAATFAQGDANVVDAKTRRLKLGVGDFYGAPMEALAGGTFRIHFRQATENFSVGDWLVGRYGDAFKVFLADSRDCTIKDVTMMRNGFANVREDNGGGNHILHCVWTLGPRPAGATEEPLVTNAADGLHSTGASPGPDIEKCVFRGILLDDCIAIHGGFATIKAVNGTALTLDGDQGLAAGQPARISDQKGFYGEATVTALKDNGDSDLDRRPRPGPRRCRPARRSATRSGTGPATGSSAAAWRRHPLARHPRQSRRRADPGQHDPRLRHVRRLKLGPEYHWGEADYVHNVTVEGNTLRRERPRGLRRGGHPCPRRRGGG